MEESCLDISCLSGPSAYLFRVDVSPVVDGLVLFFTDWNAYHRSQLSRVGILFTTSTLSANERQGLLLTWCHHDSFHVAQITSFHIIFMWFWAGDDSQWYAAAIFTATDAKQDKTMRPSQYGGHWQLCLSLSCEISTTARSQRQCLQPNYPFRPADVHVGAWCCLLIAVLINETRSRWAERTHASICASTDMRAQVN